MRVLIRSIAKDKAIIISTHILEEVEAVCTRAVIIAKGKVLADEPPQKLTAQPTTPDTIRVTVTSKSAKDALDKVTPLAGKADVEVLDRFNGFTSLLVKPEGKASQPTQLASKLQRAKINVEEIGLYRPSLEDVFRQITRAQEPN